MADNKSNADAMCCLSKEFSTDAMHYVSNF